MRKAAEARTALRPRGGGTKDFYGNPPAGETFETGEYAGIVSYEPTELVVTVRSGTRLADLEAALLQCGQMLAFEPPHFGAQASVGGCVAAGLSGPRRANAGALRDHVLGVGLLDGRGRRLAFGGRVMKNVAGYDVSRLLAGSLGTLGVILEVSLKVLPRPARELTLGFESTQAEAIERLNGWAGQPLPISASAWKEGRLFVRLAGAVPVVDAVSARLGGELLDVERGQALWEAIREHRDGFFQRARTLWRLSVPSTVSPLALPGEWLLEWNGGLRWLSSDADVQTSNVQTIRETATLAGGHATLFRAAEKRVPAFTSLGSVEMRLMRSLKSAFDPCGVFSPGRMYAEM